MSTITIVSEFVSGGYSLCELKYPERSRLFSAHADSRSKGVLRRGCVFVPTVKRL